MSFINVFISFFVILIILFFIPFYFLVINSSNTLSFKLRKMALSFKLQKKEFYLFIKIFIYFIFSFIYLFLIYFSNDIKINYFYFIFKSQDLLFLSFFALAPLISVGIFIFFRIFDKKNKFYLTIFSKTTITFSRTISINYLLETLDHYLSFVVWVLIMPILINIYNPLLDFHVVVFFCNILLIISLIIFEFLKWNEGNYRFFQANESITKIRIIKFLIWINVFLVNMFLSNFQFNIVLVLLITAWTKFFSKYLFIFQYVYFFSEKNF